jgi:hypothetical protein
VECLFYAISLGLGDGVGTIIHLAVIFFQVISWRGGSFRMEPIQEGYQKVLFGQARPVFPSKSIWQVKAPLRVVFFGQTEA